MTNEWMKDEDLKDINPDKLAFLQTLVFESSNLKREQLIPFLLNVAKRGQEKKVTFSEEEISSIVDVLRKYATSDEIAKMEKVLAMRAKSR